MEKILQHEKTTQLVRLSTTSTGSNTSFSKFPTCFEPGKYYNSGWYIKRGQVNLWSLGVVLYEMVTGKQPFRGEHEAAILYSVVNEQPQPVQTFVPDASPELIHILRRALEKEPSERYQSAADMLIDLRRLKKDTSRTGFLPVSGGKKGLLSRRNKVVLVTAFLVLLCVTGYLYFASRGAELNPAFTSHGIEVPFERISSIPAISPDGKWVVFGALDRAKKWDLYVVSTAGGDARRLTTDSIRAADANISPDGNTVVYARGDGSLSRGEICSVPFNGGTSRKIAVGGTPKWSHNGKRIGYLGFHGYGEFWTINPDGTDNRLEFADTIGSPNVWIAFAWSPDGRSVAWVRRLKTNTSEIVIHDLESDVERPVISDKTFKNEICWAPNGQLIYSSSVNEQKQLWMVPASGGTPVQVTKVMSGVDYPILSRDGQTLLFEQSLTMGHLWLAKLDGSMQREEIFSSSQSFEYPDISPDGKFITVEMTPSSYGSLVSHIFVMNRDGTNMQQITSGDIASYVPKWSLDGKLISYVARGMNEPEDSQKVYVVNPHKLDVPRFVGYGTGPTWADSVTLEIEYQKYRQWRWYLDGRAPYQFSTDSILARTFCNGQYVYIWDLHSQARLSHKNHRVCRIEDWDGKGPSNSIILPWTERNYWSNPDAMYALQGHDIIRVSYHDWKAEKVNVNVDDISVSNFFVRTTADGKEMVYKTNASVTKMIVIENLFK